MTSSHCEQGRVPRASDTSVHFLFKTKWWIRFHYYMSILRKREVSLERSSNSTQITQLGMDRYGIQVWAWGGVGRPENSEIILRIMCVYVGIYVVHIFSAGGGGLGCGKFPWFSLDSWRLSGRRSNPAPSESRRLAWQLPVVSHLPNGGTKQMLHFLLCGQMYWTGSSNLKTKQRRLNLWKTCPVRKITFIRNQLILCLFIFLNFPI